MTAGAAALVNARNDGGFTPLHYAAWAGCLATTKALLSYGADINATCSELPAVDWVMCAPRSTPLHLAAIKGDFDVARALLGAYAESLSAHARVHPTFAQ